MAANNDWWNSFSPAIETIVGGVAAVFGKTLWNSFFAAKSDQAKQDKADENDRRQLVRNLDTRASAELERAWKRCDELQAVVETERKSGMGHYYKSLHLYDYIVESTHDWRNGKAPPDKVPDFDAF